MEYLAVLGRQPELSLAELESLLGAAAITESGPTTSILNVSPDVEKLGGTLKIGQIIATMENKSQSLTKILRQYLMSQNPRGKLHLGISFYDITLNNRLSRLDYELKSFLKKQGRSVRLITSPTHVLNSAQVAYNGLIGERGIEILIASVSDKYVVARTMAVQNIDSFTLRDRSKPIRDPKVGMLPPKLARMMINFGGSSSPSSLMDPFCGCGTILIEAMVSDCRELIASDISREMVAATKTNLDWCQKNYQSNCRYQVDIADATKHHWPTVPDFIVSETWLGPPISHLPSEIEIARFKPQADQLIVEFLNNIGRQQSASGQIILAIPAWWDGRQYHHLPLIDSLDKFGYNRVSLKHVKGNLIYRRPDQFVGREILILRR